MTSNIGQPRADAIAPARVREVLSQHVLADGFRIVYDTKASQGCWIVDAISGEKYLDLYTFFASSPLGSNPRGLADDPEFLAVLAEAASNKPANPDMYTTHYAQFVETFTRVLGDPALPHLFFVEGGALAVENALKTAFDWKSRRNEAAGRSPELGTKVLHLHPRVPRPVRVHAVADQHRAGQDRQVPQVRLAPDRRARGQVPAGDAPGRGRAGRGAGARPGAGGVRGQPARHRLLPGRADPGRGRRQPHAARVPPRDAGACATSTTRCSCSTRCRPGSA